MFSLQTWRRLSSSSSSVRRRLIWRRHPPCSLVLPQAVLDTFSIFRQNLKQLLDASKLNPSSSPKQLTWFAIGKWSALSLFWRHSCNHGCQFRHGSKEALVIETSAVCSSLIQPFEPCKRRIGHETNQLHVKAQQSTDCSPHPFNCLVNDSR